ncbi:MAG TPA: deaminase [Alphaproteobacteria bacterium]|nr:deaminase [Alphaproteobacteria bacterium]
MEKLNIEYLTRTNNELDRIFLKAAYDYAWIRSEDERTKTGANIARNGVIRAKGANHFMPGTENVADRSSPEKKHLYIIHAEKDAIANGKRNKVAFALSTMYMPWIPCVSCYNAVIESGIKKMVVHRDLIERTPERWIKNLNETLEMARDKFQIVMYEGKIGNGTKSLFNGEEWNP